MYLMICEYGRVMPFPVIDIYEAERTNGLVGFVKAVIRVMPITFEDIIKIE